MSSTEFHPVGIVLHAWWGASLQSVSVEAHGVHACAQRAGERAAQHDRALTRYGAAVGERWQPGRPSRPGSAAVLAGVIPRRPTWSGRPRWRLGRRRRRRRVHGASHGCRRGTCRPAAAADQGWQRQPPVRHAGHRGPDWKPGEASARVLTCAAVCVGEVGPGGGLAASCGCPTMRGGRTRIVRSAVVPVLALIRSTNCGPNSLIWVAQA